VPNGVVYARLQSNGSGIAQSFPVSNDGSAFVPVTLSGQYSLQVDAGGFITQDIEVSVPCSADDCGLEKLVALSPLLEPGLARIIMTWDKDIPKDIDIHVMALKNSDNSSCRTYHGNKNGCPSVSLDLDNLQGGLNGAETVTLLDNSINSQYTYLIAIIDYRFENNGESFPKSGAQISVTNGIQTIDVAMNVASITQETGFYFFGCLELPTSGTLQFKPAPEGTMFNGKNDDQWLPMKAHCQG